MATSPVIEAHRACESFSTEEKGMIDLLVSLDQSHLFKDWDPPGTNDPLKRQFFQQVKKLHTSYPGGLQRYVSNAKTLLLQSKNGENPLDGWVPEVPSGVEITPLSPEAVQLEREGLNEVGRVGFVLVAGGLGERLGYSGIKIELPVETVHHTSYISTYCHSIAAIQERYGHGIDLPLAIMVSDDTNQHTIDLLEANNYYGLKKSQVTILKQEKVPALLDNDAHFALHAQYEIDAKPHGHGDVHSLLYHSGTIETWMGMGIKWVYFFQDTNGLAFFSLPAQLGVSVRMNLEVNSMAVPRVAKQALGAIARLKHRDGIRSMTINVEYNQLDPVLRSTVSPEGDVNVPETGLSPFPGNINQLLFAIDPYHDTLYKSHGTICEFVNPKYADSTRTVFKKPTRLECMMQDYAKILSPTANVGFTVAPAWFCYSACKNNIVDAAAAVKSGIPAMAAYTAESDQYAVWTHLLRDLGCQVKTSPTRVIAGISAVPSPRFVFHPSFALFSSELLAKFTNPRHVVISETSTLAVSGNCFIKSLYLEGALNLDSENSQLVVDFDADSASVLRNKGHILVTLDELESGDVPEGIDKSMVASYVVKEVDRMRGYVIFPVEVKNLTVDSKGESYIFDGMSLRNM